MFATGIENSYPTINQRPDVRVDEMEKCGHYEHWRDGLRPASRSSASSYLRYGPPIHRTYLGPGQYDWEFADLTFAELKRRDIIPIVDLCHFGVPDWIGNFQNPDFPELFADYAGAFAERFPWVQLYTPVNEMFICAVFSAHYGWWNEQLTTDQSFVTALKHIVQGQRPGDAARSSRSGPTRSSSRANRSEYFHAEKPGSDRPRRDAQRQSASCRST